MSSDENDIKIDCYRFCFNSGFAELKKEKFYLQYCGQSVNVVYLVLEELMSRLVNMVMQVILKHILI